MSYLYPFAFILLLTNGTNAIAASSDSLVSPFGNFISLSPSNQDLDLHIPLNFTFQTIAVVGDSMSDGNVFRPRFDFTGYVPMNGSSEKGYLSINHESVPGGVSMMDLEFDTINKRWKRSNEKEVDFSPVFYTVANCSGTVTPWNTIITCEEYAVTTDFNNDGYYDNGWAIEIDPVTKEILNGNKLRALGHFNHENIVIHSNLRTAYQGADHTNGYFFKFVADNPQDLTSGDLYVLKLNSATSGDWLLLANETKTEQNTTTDQAAALGATVFAGIEDVEISPINGMIYFAVKGTGTVYRFQDSDPISGMTISNFEVFLGDENMVYSIPTATGTVSEPWGTGNDNLAFDNDGNLWILQDGDRNFVWFATKNHTITTPDVGIFMKTPSGSEPTGITFTPDNKFMFISIQHPSATNIATTQSDASERDTSFDKGIAMVISLKSNFGFQPCNSNISQPNSLVTPAYYRATNKVTSQGIIQNSSNVFFSAEKSIELQPGFQVENGSLFKAKIDNCLD
ncbi:hypothetical protein SAMN06298216_0675 [Spirosomataceae bacterium TFI 002]|nr:hypothetical protein SAMN06298216_0675 [Spirosomataceae bacterium TFI 002]